MKMIKFQILKIISFFLTKYLYLKCISLFLSTFPLEFNPGFGEDRSYFRIKKCHLSYNVLFYLIAYFIILFAMSLVNGWCDAIRENSSQ